MNEQAIRTFDQTPRPVPWSIKPSLLFGGALPQFGWFFFGFGMIFVWAFTLNSDISALWQFAGQVQTAKGRVLAVDKTSFSEGGSDTSPGTPVYQIEYEFTDDSDKVHQGVCYRAGWNPDPGKSVSVEYPAGRPGLSRIKNTHRKPVSWFGILPVLFPLFGLCFILPRLLNAPWKLRVLRWGRLASGKLIEKKKTNVQVNDQPVYKLTYEYADIVGHTQHASIKTHETQRLEDTESELLLYEPSRPGRAVFLDSLPCDTPVDETGYLQGRTARGIAVLIVPTVSIVGHTIAALCLLF